jgi:hypothetical protein
MPPASDAGAAGASRTKLLFGASCCAFTIWVLIKTMAASNSDVKRVLVDLIGMSPV